MSNKYNLCSRQRTSPILLPIIMLASTGTFFIKNTPCQLTAFSRSLRLCTLSSIPYCFLCPFKHSLYIGVSFPKIPLNLYCISPIALVLISCNFDGVYSTPLLPVTILTMSCSFFVTT